ncbi:MAG TPA: glycosyltransferase, partial [Opitutae bacterium]|nr:glycosyltransferase [Opitutae bacterium]
CIGAAIAFLTGMQTRIPKWADRIYIGWQLRIIADPKTFLPRYWSARKLRTLLKQWGEQLPQVS